MVQVGVELGLFKAMVIDDEPRQKWALTDLAANIGADGTLLYRVLRYLFPLGLLQESPDATYSATDATRWLATEAAESHVRQACVA
ncbi:hypothetical protein LTR57_024251 [Friedmanniomyces endolithicus]|nr:hypothetical protein LTR57_024251 [Friedmanniomyces endolithicus]KAK0953510.1 hypothetical protein LTS01_024339 [Friedmanniomyces endolithicus]